MNQHSSHDHERQALRQQFPVLYDAVMELLYRYDPMKIKEPFILAGLQDKFEVPLEEYEPETQTILPRLKEANSALALRKIVYEEFVRWFHPLLMEGDEESFTELAEEMWGLIKG